MFFQPILRDDMIDQKVVQDAGTHDHLEKYSSVTIAAYNPPKLSNTMKSGLDKSNAMFTLNPHFC